MADLISSHIDSALHDLEYLAHASRFEGYNFQSLRLRLRNLKRFVRTCGNQGSSTSLLVWIAETVRRNAEQLYSQVMVLEFEGAIISMKGRIDQWLDDREPGTSCIPDDVLENISSISEALLDVRSAMVWPKTENLQEIMDALEEQLSFMKRLISYLATRTCAGSIRDLLTHSESLTVNATNLLVTFENWGDFESKLSIYLQKLEPVYETYTQSLSSLKLEGRFLGSTQVMDDGAFYVMKDFLDSLVSNLWDLLRLNSCEVSVKDLPELYGGLRSLRTALKQRQFDNLSMKIKEDTEDAVCDAGVFICSLHHTLLTEVDVGLLEILFDTINTIMSESGAQEPQVPMLNFPGQEDRFYTRIKEDVLRTSPEGSEKEFDVKKMPPEGASSSTNEEEMQLVDQLTRGSMQLRIVAIVGMPGLGKTTLATKVYNNPFVSFHFHIRASCPLSHVVDEKKVLLDLLNQIYPWKHFTTEQDLAHTLRRNLHGRKYLIFLDDVWDLEAWTLLKELLPDNNVGSRIILTSRRHDVAPHNLMVDGRPYFLRQLSEDESLELLQSKLSFGLSLDLGMKIAEKCNGLPLIVVIVAGVLKHAEPAGWDELLDCLSNVSITEQFTNTLELSYNQLPVHLRPCFLYFGTFPENKKISVRKLLRLWTAEGFIQGEDMYHLEDAAEHCLNDLIARSLIMVAEQKSLGGVKACRIHDLVHDFCLRKAKDEHFFHFLRGYDELSAFSEPNDLQRLCIHSEAEHFKQSRLFCPLARSLILNSSESTERLVEGIVWRYISSPLPIFKRLNVLDLEQVHFGYRFPKEIRQLVQLTFLAILSEARVVPSWIGNLLNLETLIVLGDSPGILPHSLWDLQNLQYLYFGGIGYLLPTESLDRPFALQGLDRISGVVIPSSNMESLLRKFPNVRRLKFLLQYDRDDSYNLLVPNILSRMQSLTVSPDRSTELDELSFPANLKKLTLGRFVLSERNIATIGELPNLEVFKLLRTRFEMNAWTMKEGEFSKLKFLKLVGLELVRWYADDDQLDCLQKLVLEYCSILKEVPSCLDSIPTLEVIELFNCRFTVIDLVKRIEGRRNELMGDSGLKIIVNNVSPYSFPK